METFGGSCRYPDQSFDRPFSPKAGAALETRDGQQPLLAALSSFAQRPPERFGIGEQQIEAIPADGEMIALAAGDITETNGRQLGGLAATVAGSDGGLRDGVFHAPIVPGPAARTYSLQSGCSIAAGASIPETPEK